MVGKGLMAKEFQSDYDDAQALEQELQQLTQRARIICETGGDRSQDCVAARNAVHEMETTVLNYYLAEQNRTFFERHCAEHPDALDCRIYDL